MTENFSITLRCLFCEQPLTGPEGAEYSSGDLIKCSECGEENEFSAVLDIAKDEGVAKVQKQAENEIAKAFKNFGKK